MNYAKVVTRDRAEQSRLSKVCPTSWVGELGMSAPAHKPFTAISRNLAPGVLEYSRFHESSTIVLFGSSSSGFFALGSGLGSAGSSSSSAAATCRTGLADFQTSYGKTFQQSVISGYTRFFRNCAEKFHSI